MSYNANSDPLNPRLRWWQMLLAGLIFVAFVVSTRYYELDAPILRLLAGNRWVDAATLHQQGEFVENNLGTVREADGSYTLRMIAQQYMFVPHCVRIPAGVPVHLRITSADNPHTLTATGLDLKVKVVPGHITTALLRVPEPGDFPMPCNEFCGTGHFTMISRLEVVPADQFQNVKPADRESCGPQ